MTRFVPALALLLAGCVYTYPTGRSHPIEPPVQKSEMERLLAAGISEGVILEVVERRGTQRVSSDDLVTLKQAGASDGLLEKVVACERREPPRVVYYESPVYYYPYRHWHYYDYGWWPSFRVGYSYWGRRSRLGFYFGR